MSCRQRGFGLVEIMVGITLASLMTIAVVNVYLTQSLTFNKQTSRNGAAEDAWGAFNLIDTLLKHAEVGSIVINYGAGANNDPDDGSPVPIELLDGGGAVAEDEIMVTFQTPRGMSVWPNDDVANNYNRNQMRLTWENDGDDAYAITIQTNDGTGWGNRIVIAGGDAQGNSKVINLDLWPLDRQGNMLGSAADPPLGGYRLVLSTRAGIKTGDTDPVITLTGIAVPRNL